MPWLSATGGAANASRRARYGATAAAPSVIAPPFRNRRRDTDCRSKTFPLGTVHLRAQHQQREQVDERPVRPRVRVGALPGQPRLEVAARVARRVVDTELIEPVLHGTRNAHAGDRAQLVAGVVAPDEMAGPVGAGPETRCR